MPLRPLLWGTESSSPSDCCMAGRRRSTPSGASRTGRHSAVSKAIYLGHLDACHRKVSHLVATMLAGTADTRMG
jgi:hypothetical protein